MDITSQLQEQVNTFSALAVDAFGTLQRDAPPVKLSSDCPEPHTSSSEESQETFNVEEPKIVSAALVKPAKQVDALVAAFPLSGVKEKIQLKRIAELQAENEVVGRELQKQLEATEQELKRIQELFNQAAGSRHMHELEETQLKYD